MKIRPLLFNSTLLAIIATSTLAAADFSFTSILRAGARGNAAAGWEIGTGASSGSIASGTQFNDSDTPGWSDSIDRQFRIGYNQSTNTAYTTVWDSAGNTYTANFNPVGGGPLTNGGNWLLNANLTADPAVVPDSSVRVAFVGFGNGLTVLQPVSTTPLIASQPTGSSQVGTSAPIVFSAGSNSGNWYLDGVIRFSGLSPYSPNGARDSELQFSLTASATRTPEPATVLLLSSGLVALAYYKRRRKEISLR
ncbi:MAG: PEP-CTERM sorting domain-containing protein [Acidobacteria bacterium]|nr:PEP-CTERM sorting domain-containing protein [Acidobacteriota bacterium]